MDIIMIESGRFQKFGKVYFSEFLYIPVNAGFSEFFNLFKESWIYVNTLNKKSIDIDPNFLFHDTVDRTKATPIILLLTTTTKTYNLDICLYLETVLQKILDYRMEPAGILPKLMPRLEKIQNIC